MHRDLRHLPHMRGPDARVLRRINLAYLSNAELRELCFQIDGEDFDPAKTEPRWMLLHMAGLLRDGYLDGCNI